MVCIGTLNSPPSASPPKQTKHQIEELVERHKFNRVSDALKPSEPGAAAHMSLHQSNNEKKRTAEPATFLPPRYQGGEDCYRFSGEPRSTSWLSAVDEGLSMPTRPTRQRRFAILCRHRVTTTENDPIPTA
jgi:hypothetical protein